MKQILRITFCALLGLALLRPAPAQIAISVGFAPPALPIYVQPVCPQEGFIWVPGYWAWDADFGDYYWVPGTWVMAPQVGLLWTPAWWGWENGAFLFHDGYWASEVGFYGGVNYGFGYFGEGFYGGRWDHDRFMYNRAVMNVNVTEIHNVYEDRTVIINNRTENRVSYNGGEGGITARPTPREEQVSRLQHFPPARPQQQNREMARSNPQLRASANQGKPPVAATARPAEFSGSAVVAAKAAGAPYHPPANRAGGGGGNARPGNESRPGDQNTQRGGEAARPGGVNPGANPTHAKELPPHQPTHIDGGANVPGNQKYEKQQEKLAQQQNKEHQKLEAQQQKDHQQATKKGMNQEKQQQMEQRHQQQTQQMQQRHTQQQQQLESRQPHPQAHPQAPPREPKPQ
jgi:hypothetical protein